MNFNWNNVKIIEQKKNKRIEEENGRKISGIHV